MVIILFVSMFSGCNKRNTDKTNKGFIYTEFYSGPETYYPDNMPAATKSIPKKHNPTEGYIPTSQIALTTEMFFELWGVYSRFVVPCDY